MGHIQYLSYKNIVFTKGFLLLGIIIRSFRTYKNAEKRAVERLEWIIAALDVELDPTIQLEISDVERKSGIQRRECYRQ
jgi:hypothetical protein